MPTGAHVHPYNEYRESGETSFRSSRSYARRLFIFFSFLSSCLFSFPIFSSLLPVTYAVAKIMVEKALLGTLILQLLAWLFIFDVWFAFFNFSVWQLSVVDWSIVVCRWISLWFCTMMIYRIKVLLCVTFDLPRRRWEGIKRNILRDHLSLHFLFFISLILSPINPYLLTTNVHAIPIIAEVQSLGLFRDFTYRMIVL